MMLTNCTFANNFVTDGGNGGAIFDNAGSSGTITNCTFFNNSADGNGGAFYYDVADSTVTVTNCTFNMNSATEGGAIFGYFGPISLDNTLVAGNTATTGPDLFASSSTFTANFSLIGTDSGSSNGYTLTADSGNNLLGTTDLDLGDAGGQQRPASRRHRRHIDIADAGPAERQRHHRRG